MSAFAATAALAGSVAAAIALAPSPSPMSRRWTDAGVRRARSQPPAEGLQALTEPERRGQCAAGWKNDAQWARPGSNPFGKGPKPPMVALD